MLNYWFLFDTSTGAIYPSLSGPQPASEGMGVLGPYPQDTAPQDVVMAYTYPSRYLAQGSPAALVAQPYLTLAASLSGPTQTITATLSGPAANPVPTKVTFTVLGQTYTEAITSGVATLLLDEHASVSGLQYTVEAATTGCVGASVTLGSAAAPVGLQVYQPASGNPQVAPVGPGSKAFVRAWAMGLTAETQLEVLTQSLQNLMIALEPVAHILTSKIIPALTSATYAPITLTTAEQAALTNWQTNVEPHFTPLASLLDSSGNPIVQYAEMQTQAPQASQQAQAYASAVGSGGIPGVE